MAETYMMVKQKMNAMLKPLPIMLSDFPYTPVKAMTSAMSSVIRRPVIQRVFLRPHLSTYIRQMTLAIGPAKP